MGKEMKHNNHNKRRVRKGNSTGNKTKPQGFLVSELKCQRILQINVQLQAVHRLLRGIKDKKSIIYSLMSLLRKNDIFQAAKKLENSIVPDLPPEASRERSLLLQS